jgi:HK97 family phage major capsid protein
MTNKMQERRDNAAKRIKDLLDLAKEENRGLSAEEKTIHQNAVAEINDVDDIMRRSAELDHLAEQTLPELEERSFTPQKAEPEKESVDERAQFRAFLSGRMSEYNQEVRAMTTDTGSTGGFMIPEKYSNLLREYTAGDIVIRNLATVEQWDADGAFPVVTDFGTSYIVGEGDDGTTTNVTLAQKTVSGHQLMYRTEVPMKLINTSQYNLEEKLMGWWAKSKAAKEEALFASGGGTTEPYGLDELATAGTDTAANSAIAADDVVNWYFDCPATYRPAASWIFADGTIKLIRKIVNEVSSSGATMYVWQPGFGGEPDTLMGRPIYASRGMTAFAAGATVGVFGDISQYIVVDFGKPQMIRDPYTVAIAGQVRFVGWQLIDAALPVAEAIIACNILS